MDKKRLGTLEVSALGLGCMEMTGFYGNVDRDQCIQAILVAFEQGISFFDTADSYGFGDNETLVGTAVASFRNKVCIATKVGVVRNRRTPNIVSINGTPEYIRQQCIASLKRLRSSTIDLYCKELGIGLVACAPISRGLLSGTMIPFIDLLSDDFRRKFPRFESENLAHNCKIVSSLSSVAQGKSCSLSQLALAWVSTQSPSFIPLFGTTRGSHVQESIKSLEISFTKSEINSINEIVSKGVVQGSRHPEMGKQFYGTQ